MSLRLRALALPALLWLLLPACSAKKVAVNVVGDAIADGGGSLAKDDDPELVAAAAPFGLKTMESLLEASPRNQDLLLAATSGFVQYAYAFVQTEADYVEARDLARATEQRARAKRLYLRARGYGLRGLDVRHERFEERLRADTGALLAQATREDVPFLYWTGAAWGAAAAISKTDAELSADLPLVEAMMRRALALDEGYGKGAVHDFLMSYEAGRPASGGGSVERARGHFERALSVSGGSRASLFVSWAESVSVQKQDRAEFRQLLERALAIDPDAFPDQRLANLIAQKRARWLLSRSDDLFLE